MTKQKRSWGKISGTASGVVLGLYVLSFVFLFQIFGSPSRTRYHWLGPTPRHDAGAMDIGKVFEWGAADEAPVPVVFTVYWPMCKLWLLANGLSD